jgi:phosphoglycerate kinase
MNKLIINQLPVETLRGKRVFVRIDVDSAHQTKEGFADNDKLRATMPTLEYLIAVGARIIIGTHLGSPGGKTVESLRLDQVAKQLGQLLRVPVRKLNGVVGRDTLLATSDMRDGDLILLENLGFHPGEDSNDSEFARQLGQICDVYCNDAFALAHRGLASTVGITRYVHPAVAGLGLARELMMIEAVLEKPEPPFVAIIAGTRIEEKLPIMENLLPRLNRLFVGGTLAFKFLKAKGQNTGAAELGEAFQPSIVDFLRKAEKKVEIILPQDFIVVKADEFRAYVEGGRIGPVPASRRVLDSEILPSDLPVDIGPWTVDRIKGLFDGAHTIFWNGPLGLWETESFGSGTHEVAKLIAERVSPKYQHSIIAGDSLSQAIYSFGLPIESLHHLTAGGDSTLQLLAGDQLPAVVALDNEVDLVARIEPRPRHILLPVDGSPHSLEAARKLGELLNVQGTEISLLRVEDGLEEDSRETDAKKIFSATNAALASQGLTAHRQLLVEGDPADEILKFADDEGIDLIAMGSHGRTGVLRLLMGSVSRKVLDQASCPVLIVRIPDEEMARAGMLDGI